MPVPIASPSPDMRARLLRVAAIVALLAAAYGIYTARSITSAPAGTEGAAAWQEIARQQLVRYDFMLRMSFFIEQYGIRNQTDPKGLFDPQSYYNDAVAGYERIALSKRYTNPFARYRLGIIYALRGFPEKAQPLLLDAARADTGNEAMHIALARLFSPNADEDRSIEEVLPELEKLPRWMQDLTLPKYYRLIGDDDALDAAELAAANHQWLFGIMALYLGAAVAILVALGLFVILRAMWFGIRPPKRETPNVIVSSVPMVVPWKLIDVAELIAASLFALVLLGQLKGIATAALGPTADIPQIRASIICAHYLLLALTMFAVMRFRLNVSDKQKLSVLGLRTFGKPAQLIWAGVLGYGVYLAALAILPYALKYLIGVEIPAAQIGVQLFGDQTWLSAIIYIALLGLIAPVVEELVFRGFIHAALRRYLTPFAAVIASSVVFAFMHISSPAKLPLVALAIVLAVLYERTHSVWPCIVCHAINNLLVISVVLLLNY